VALPRFLRVIRKRCFYKHRSFACDDVELSTDIKSETAATSAAATSGNYPPSSEAYSLESSERFRNSYDLQTTTRDSTRAREHSERYKGKYSLYSSDQRLLHQTYTYELSWNVSAAILCR
jgi:hypothetical protein